MTGPDPVAAPFAATACFAGPASLAGPASTRLTTDGMLTTEGNRWSSAGEPTIYLAGDVGIALAEFGRHADPREPERACVWAVRVELEAVADLRAASGHDRSGSAVAWLLDRAHCSDLATRLRSTGRYEALVVPSVAMLDRLDRWNLVVFADRLRRPIFDAVRPGDAQLKISPAAGSNTG